jgi:hypothetical protein
MPASMSSFLIEASNVFSRAGKTAVLQKQLSATADYDGQGALISDLVGRCEGPITYLEFGVYKGESMNLAVRTMDGRDFTAVGFDSFEGLPSEWNRYFGYKMKEGTFDTGGQTPAIEDRRVRFVKGWFEDTLPGFLRENSDLLAPQRNVVLYLDADLYAPTVFVLHRIAAYRHNFYVACDDWAGGVSEAVYDFAKSSGYHVTFLGQVRSQVHGLPKKTAVRMERHT